MDTYTKEQLQTRVIFYENVGVEKGRLACSLCEGFITEDVIRRTKPEWADEIIKLVNGYRAYLKKGLP